MFYYNYTRKQQVTLQQIAAVMTRSIKNQVPRADALFFCEKIVKQDPEFDSEHSVTLLISRLKSSDHEAANDIWHRYFQRLLPLAKARLGSSSDPYVDEEDILVSVFDRFFAAASRERFSNLDDRDDLWQILVMLTERKVIDLYRKNTTTKRGQGKRMAAADLGEIDLQEIRALANREPTPEFLAVFNENLSMNLKRLDATNSKEVALLKLEGYANQEIADQLDISLSSVERKLRVIREHWIGLS